MTRFFGILILCLALGPMAFAVEVASPASEQNKEDLIEIENNPNKGPQAVERREKEEGKPLDDAPHFFFGDNSAFSLYTGFLYYLSQTDSTGFGMYGFNYLFPSSKRLHAEAALDFFGNNESHLRLMAKWFFNTSSDVRPYVALGFGLKILNSDNLAVLFTWSRIMPHAHVGFDLSLAQHWSLKSEIFMGIDQGLNSYIGILTGPVFSF